jgi:uncharacterized protein (UPF0332 family)
MWENTFKQIMDLWVTPEVVRRQASGSIPKPYDLIAAQVLFHTDGRPNEIRLNEEVRAIGKIRFKNGVLKKKGDPVYAHEVDSYESFSLPDSEDPNCGHITLMRLGDQWSLAFDFLYNKKIAGEHLSAAKQFVSAAKKALIDNHMRVLVDTCFSAAELTAKALLLTTPLPGENKRMSHGRIHARYNLEAKLGNVNVSHKDAFNRLTALRNSARYLNGKLVLDENEARDLVQSVEEAIEFAAKRIQPHST